TDIDCGGKACPACLTGAVCKKTSDCAEKGCLKNRCVRPLALSFASPDFLRLQADTVRGLAAGDFNGDGKPDLAVLDAEGGQVFVLVGAGNGKFADPLSIAVGKTCWDVVAGDLNEDGADDLAVPTLDGQCTVVLSDGSGGFFAADPRTAAVKPTVLAMGDI